MEEKKYLKTDIYKLKGQRKIRGDKYGEFSAGDMDSDFRHSTYYHNFFEGYTEVKEERPGHHYKIKRIYTSPWIIQDVTDSQWISFRLLYGGLFFVAVFSYIWSLTRDIASNYCWYVALIGLITAVPLVMLFFIILYYSFARRNMTLWEYKSRTKRLKITAFIGAIMLESTAFMIFAYLCINRGEEFWNNVINIILITIASLALFFIYFIESKMKYKSVPNTNQAPDGGSIIC